MEQKLVSIPMTTLFKSGKASNVSVVRVNANQYPYVTILNKDGKSNNVYFGKKSSEVAKNFFGKSIIPLLVDADLCQTANTNGEVRFKISLSGNSDYATQSEMALLGVEFAGSDEFNMNLFLSEFTSENEQPPVNTASVEDQLEALYEKFEKATTVTAKRAVLVEIKALDPSATMDSVKALLA